MLTTLRIKNLALVDDLTLELHPGYTVITGETGAGKSILVGGLKLVLGERADRTLLRAGCDICTVEAVFDVQNLASPLHEFLEANGLEPCEANQLVLKRVLTSAGSNRQFVNGSPTTLAALATIGDWLVDMHGPHDHQSLLHTARQLDILDARGRLRNEREEFTRFLRLRGEAVAQRTKLIVDEHTYRQKLDLLRFQVREIEEARLQPEEEESLTLEYQRAANAARLLELGHAVMDQVAESESAIVNQAHQITRLLRQLSELDASTTPLLRQHEQILEALTEISSSLSHYLDRVEADPARLQQLEERINLLQSLKRKYGATLTDILAFGDDARIQLQSLEQRDQTLEQINREINSLNNELYRIGKQLSEKRRKLIPRFSREVGHQLKHLGFKAGRFEVTIQTDIPDLDQNLGAPSTSGFDTVEFQFSANPGEPERSLRAIGSSGELARVMLALKTVLAVEDEVPVLIFDEVDANVGGTTANAVGNKMKQIARQRQVLCITHLPQVAAPATHHCVVTKTTAGGRTLSSIVAVTGNDRVQELSRMLGGAGEAAFRHAREMLTSRASAA